MSRITKWKPEKSKVKVVFRLQFHATHIPERGWEKLFISFIPSESGKSTAKTTKANVRNGTCKWADPIYETTRLLQDSKTKHFEEKFYKFVVATGTSRSSILGEAILNLADYADAADAQKPSSISLPLQGCNSGTMLHITVQLLTSKTGFREFEQQRELREGGLPSGSNANSHDDSSTGKSSSPEEIPNEQLDKVSRMSKLRPRSKERPSLDEASLTEEYADSAVGFDGSSTTSESLYTEKHDTSSLKSTVSGDLNLVSQDQSPHTGKHNLPNNHQNSANNDWVHGWSSSDYSIDHDLAAVSNEENNKLRETLQVAESSIFELKLELSSLQSNADELGLETQNFASQIADEISSSEKLGKEVLFLKEECLNFKNELARLQDLKLGSNSAATDPVLADPVRLNGILVVEDKLQKLLHKFDLGFDVGDINIFRSDVEAMLTVIQDIKQGEESECKGSNDAINQRNLELLKQLEESKVESKNLARKMYEMECYYESLVHELEENQKQIVLELKSIKNEHSTCAYTIASHKAETESIHQQMNDQIVKFSKEREDFEKRANTSEASLKRARLNYSIAVDQLQKDLELLSFQVLSVYETNANLIKKAFSEESQVFPQDTRRQTKINGGDFCIDDLKKSLCSQEDLYKKVEEELCEVHSSNLYLDVLSKALQETLAQANTHVMLMNQSIDTFTKKSMDKIQILDGYKDRYHILEEKLESVSKENFSLSKKIVECELTMKACSMERLELENSLRSEKLENKNLQSEIIRLREESKRENVLISKKIEEYEAMLKEYKGYEIKYDECMVEKSELENLLKLEKLEKETLRDEIFSLREEKQKLEDHRGTTEISLNNARSDILAMKQKFVKETQDMVTKIDTSNLHVEFLQSKLDSVSRKFQSSTEFEEKYAKQSNDFFTNIADFETELQKLTSKNRDISQQIMGLDRVYKELEKSELVITVLKTENRDLTISLNSKKMESATLASQLNAMRESLDYVQDELNVERGLRAESEGKIEDINSHLEKIRVSRDLLEKESSSIKGMENELVDMHGSLIAADVALACITSHHEALGEVLVAERQHFSDSNESLKAQLEECQRRLEIMEEEQLKQVEENDEQMKHGVCFAEKSELEYLLKMERLENGSLQNNISSLKEEFRVLKAEIDDVAASKENLQKTVDYIDEKLRNLLGSYDDRCGEIQHESYSKDLKGLFLKFEKMQENSKDTIRQLMEKQKELETEKGKVEILLSNARSEILELKQKFKNEICNMESKLDTSNARIENLQLKLNSEFQEKHVQQSKEIFTSLAVFEAELQKLSSKNRDFAQEILGLDTVHEELERSELTVAKLRKEISDLTISLNGKLNESSSLESELYAERGLRGKLEDQIGHLTSKLSEAELEQSRVLCELFETNELLIAADVEHTCVRSHYKTLAEILAEKLKSSDETLKVSTASEASYIKQNAIISKDLESLRFDLESSATQNRGSSDSDDSLKAQLVECKRRLQIFEEEHLKQTVGNDEEDIRALALSKQEHEIMTIVLKSKLDEQHARLMTLEHDNIESLKLKKQFNDLHHKLSEQILKTEEYKNLSIHLKDLKDREKKESEGPSIAIQESLRIAFMKEQHESKMQEMKQQLSISKKHGEELLWKLQDVVDEIENRKKSEALNLKKIEELSNKIVELEGELQSVISDKRERANDYDRIKAELECSLLSLECCKEEKEKLVSSLQELKVENSRIMIELDLIKGLMEKSKLVDPIEGGDLVDVGSFQNGETARSIQGDVERKSIHDIQEDSVLNPRDLARDNNYLRAESLRSSMDHLHEELERMKNENSLLQTEIDPKYEDLEGEFTQLQKANEELGNMYPLFNEIGGGGSALERVLALEIELAESLREKTKKKSALQFQSSFLKQHSDEEAVFRSFKDINELIKEMLELKGRYSNVENDLKEMQDRYSQLSLQFAEVEGERQKLMMTLKNIRTPKKLIRSSSNNLQHPS